VKEDDSLKLTRTQDPDFLVVIIAGYDWKYLTEERNCELAVSIGFYFFIDFVLLFLFTFYLGLIIVQGFLVIKLRHSRSLSHQIS
jgi:hypothetical protein